jgi:hypothetical protein
MMAFYILLLLLLHLMDLLFIYMLRNISGRVNPTSYMGGGSWGLYE